MGSDWWGVVFFIDLDGIDQAILWAKYIRRHAPHCMSGALHKDATKHTRCWGPAP